MKNAVLVPLSLYTIGLYNDHVNEETGLFDLQSFNHALTEHNQELISEIEKKIEEYKSRTYSDNTSWIRAEALTEIINLIKET